MTYRIHYSPESKLHLREIRNYIRSQSSRDVATRFVSALLAECAELKTFPHRGTLRTDLRENLRVIGFRDTASIHFEVGKNAVTILAFTYAGRNWFDDYREANAKHGPEPN